MIITDFGYCLAPSNAVKVDKTTDWRFEKLCALESDVLKCIGCGSCTAVCSAGHFSQMNLRQCILSLSRGQWEKSVRSLSRCMLCGKCLMVCPRGINTRHLILSICRIYCPGEGGSNA
ncbi:MAG: 4Fe-4S dicluster domain-containing protein [Bacteroidales bacterium]|nr:4Fe-4S dicluster domain-containing protein [Bacteroidales bacterium]